MPTTFFLKYRQHFFFFSLAFSISLLFFPSFVLAQEADEAEDVDCSCKVQCRRESGYGLWRTAASRAELKVSSVSRCESLQTFTTLPTVVSNLTQQTCSHSKGGRTRLDCKVTSADCHYRSLARTDGVNERTTSLEECRTFCGAELEKDIANDPGLRFGIQSLSPDCSFGGSYVGLASPPGTSTERLPPASDAKPISSFWTCLLTFSPKEGQTTGETKCKDFSKAETFGGPGSPRPQNEAEARAQCYKSCDLYADKGPGRPIRCLFTTSRQCNADGKTLDDVNFGLQDYTSEALAQLRKDAGDLQRFKADSIPGVIGLLITTALGILGSLAFVFFIYGGILWMTAGGNSDRQVKAMRILLWTTLGIIIVLASYVLTDFILQSFIP